VAGKFRENLRQRLPGVLARGDGDQFRMRMVQEQLHQNFAGVTRRTDDGHFFRFHFQKFNRELHKSHELFFLLVLVLETSIFDYEDEKDDEEDFKQKTPPD
jgi:hypothetical protein